MPVALLDENVPPLDLVVLVDLVLVDLLGEVDDVAVLDLVCLQRRSAPLNAIRREVAVLDALPKRIDVGGSAEVVDVLRSRNSRGSSATRFRPWLPHDDIRR